MQSLDGLGTSVMTVENALVSVVIPLHNGESFIGDTLATVLAQTYNPIEVVVVDDGSTDSSASIVEAAAAQDNRISLFRIPNSGPGAARNFGIENSCGSMIALLDADDLWHPEKIARQVDVMSDAMPEVGVVYCLSIEIDENDFIVKPLGADNPPQGRVTEELVNSNFVWNASSPLVRRSCIRAVGGFDVDRRIASAADWKLYLALSEICEFAAVPERLVGYRQSPSAMSRNVEAMARACKLVLEQFFRKRPDFSAKLRRRAKYTLGRYLTILAINSGQPITGLKYQIGAYMARPIACLKPAYLKQDARLWARVLKPRRDKRVASGIRFGEYINANEITA
jgi:glycosyltransferase involved in cell wall biosynthesis